MRNFDNLAGETYSERLDRVADRPTENAVRPLSANWRAAAELHGPTLARLLRECADRMERYEREKQNEL